jgi:hypothetical protein
MALPQFLHFYPGYTLDSLLNEYAIRVLTLINSMHRIKSSELIDSISAVAVGGAEPIQREDVINKLEKSSRGIEGILEEVRVIRGR